MSYPDASGFYHRYARRCAMSLRPEPLPPIPDVTAAAVRAAFPKGNESMEMLGISDELR